MAVTLDRYSMSVTIKQILIGALVGTSVAGLVIHKMWQEKGQVGKPVLAVPDPQPHKVAFLRKRQLSGKQAQEPETVVSSQKLFG
jgi:hypothetical protein